MISQLQHIADQQIEFDLDDGVKVNYALFDGLVGENWTERKLAEKPYESSNELIKK